MKKVLKVIFFTVLLFACSRLVSASDLSNHIYDPSINIYKSITNNSLIYIVDADGEFQYSWRFDKDKIDIDNIDIDFRLNLSSSTIDVIEEIINNDEIQAKNITFAHHGILPSTATIKIKVDDKFEDGERLYLYYYNDSSNDLEFIEKGLTVVNGYVEFRIEHCSDYLLTGSIVKTAVGNPKSMGFIIVLLIVIVVILVASTLFADKK